jgi:bacillithiol synthase
MSDVPALATIVTEPFGGSPLTRAAIAGQLPETWYRPRPSDVEGWATHLRQVSAEFRGRRWYEAIEPAIGPMGAAPERLLRVVQSGGVVVTTGQQPGLFGGPLLTWIKALSAIALADELERATGLPTAPLFWAATDDADFEETRGTRISLPGGIAAVAVEATPEAGTPVADVPLGNIDSALNALRRASGSASFQLPIEIAEEAYTRTSTIGDAYVGVLRRLLQPLGMAVLDASHPAVRAAAQPILREAVRKSEDVAAALAKRSLEIGSAGFLPQVQEIPGLTLVFAYERGRKRRIPIREASSHDTSELGATVLVRPVVERALMPTVAYCGGPGEVAYFAQVSAVAESLGVAQHMPVPRWSATIVEPHIQRLLDRLGVDREELRTPHLVETRLARAALPANVARDLAEMRASIETQLAALEIDDTDGLLPSSAVQGTRTALLHRLDRLERRLVASVKRRETSLMQDIATATAALYPDGKRQERAINFLPILARQGRPLLDAMLAEAMRHARALIGVKASTVEPVSVGRDAAATA